MNVPATGEEALRVVIVDDTKDLRDLLRIALQRGGIEVVGEAGDGRAGIEAVQAARPDVVLLDLSMPVMDGMEALPHLRRLAPESKIIVLSGFGAGHMAQRAIDNGADGYLQKGMPLGEILSRVREIAFGTTEDRVGTPSSHASTAARPLRAVPDPQATAGAALELSPYGVLEVGVDAPFPILHWNPAAAALLGHEPQVGRPMASESEEISRLLAENLAEGRGEFSASDPALGVQVMVRRARQSLLLYLAATSEEIEDLRRTVATTAHEIRGPVAVLSALAETISGDDLLDDDQRDRLMASVVRQARALGALTEDLLVTAQSERGALRIERRPVDPAATIAAVLADQQVSVTLEVSDRRPVFADPLRLDQMLGNLVRNAVKYGQPPIEIHVRTHELDPDMVAIDVQDQGDGVPVEFRSRLFQEFARAAGTSVSGVGLGLHVVRTLALAHGGTVTYAPGTGGGAVFTLALPAA